MMGIIIDKPISLGLIDTHCHIDIERHFPDCEEEIHSAEAAGVTDLVLAGVDRAGWSRMLRLSREFRALHAAPGLHPMYLHHHHPEDIQVLDSLVSENGVVAIGEVGLDYHVTHCDRQEQQNLFESQMEIAESRKLPLLLHVRKAHDKVLWTIRKKRFTRGGIVHAFNGSYQQACHFLDNGFMIGICGTITFDRARKIRKVASQLPLEGLVLETDAPDIPPALHWGEKNRSCYLPEILSALAEIREESESEIAYSTSLNAKRTLRLV